MVFWDQRRHLSSGSRGYLEPRGMKKPLVYEEVPGEFLDLLGWAGAGKGM